MKATSAEAYVVVWFARPVEGGDPVDGTVFVANRHKVHATWARQDASETTFVDDSGEIVARWPTAEITAIEWPDLGASLSGQDPVDAGGGRAGSAPRQGTVEWRMEVQREYPNAYQRWTDGEDDALVRDFNAGMSVDDLSATHRRRPGGITARLVRLGLIDPMAK